MATFYSTRFPFTTKKLENLRPQSKDYEVADLGCPGLRLRVLPSGRKVFRWYFQEANGKRRVLTLGTYGNSEDDIGLAAARRKLEQAKESHKEAVLHGDSEAVSGNVTTVAELAEVFYSRRIKNQRKRPEEARAVLNNDIIPKLGKRKLSTLKTPTIGGMVMSVVDRGAPVHANKVLNLTKQMFGFGESLGYLSSNPAASLRAANLGVEFNVRQRFLSAQGIRQFFLALECVPRMSEQTKTALKILLLTGVRSQELLLAKWAEVDMDGAEWTIPVENQKLTLKQAKTAQRFVVPLSSFVVDLFAELKDCAGESAWVMASEGSATGHYSGKALAKALRRLFKKELDGKPLIDMESFTPHDLRRTMRTHMAESLDVEPHVAEKCLNHSLGRLEGTYNKASLYQQRKDALDRWAEYVTLVVSEWDNVAVLRAKR